MTNEDLATVVGSSRLQLRKRLLEAKAVTFGGVRRFLIDAKFDFENKRLVGQGYALQWSLRKHPDQPESYENPQTNRGHVTLVRLTS